MTMTYHPDEPSPKLIAQLALEFVADGGKLNVKEREAILAILRQSINPLVVMPPQKRKPELNEIPVNMQYKTITVLMEDADGIQTQLEVTNIKSHLGTIRIYVK